VRWWVLVYWNSMTANKAIHMGGCHQMSKNCANTLLQESILTRKMQIAYQIPQNIFVSQKSKEKENMCLTIS
jgi:hypothetical protein